MFSVCSNTVIVQQWNKAQHTPTPKNQLRTRVLFVLSKQPCRQAANMFHNCTPHTLVYSRSSLSSNAFSILIPFKRLLHHLSFRSRFAHFFLSSKFHALKSKIQMLADLTKIDKRFPDEFCMLISKGHVSAQNPCFHHKQSKSVCWIRAVVAQKDKHHHKSVHNEVFAPKSSSSPLKHFLANTIRKSQHEQNQTVNMELKQKQHRELFTVLASRAKRVGTF